MKNEAFEKKADRSAREMLCGEKVLLGLSGGADSVALFHVLRKADAEFAAAHVNYGLRGADSEGDELFCKNLCREYDIELEVLNVNLMKITGGKGIENAGRKIRYDFFEKTAQKLGCTKIAVAHNKNDNAETVLLQLFRGTGAAGLGIAPSRGKILRPLIWFGRGEIEEFLQSNGFSFRTDLSNLTCDYSRNKIRLGILKSAAEINPAVIDKLTENTDLRRQENDFLEQEAEKIRLAITDENNHIKCDELKALPEWLACRVIRRAFFIFSGTLTDFSRAGVEAVLSLAAGGTGKKIMLGRGMAAENIYGRIVFKSDYEDQTAYSYPLMLFEKVWIREAGMLISMTGELKEFDGFEQVFSGKFDFDTVSPEICARTRKNGDRVCFPHKKKLKDFFIDEKIPRELRGRMPIIACGFDVLCLPGLSRKVSAKFKAVEATEKPFYIQGFVKRGT